MLARRRGAPSGYIKRVPVGAVAMTGVGNLMRPQEQGVSGDVTTGTRQRDSEKIILIGPDRKKGGNNVQWLFITQNTDARNLY